MAFGIAALAALGFRLAPRGSRGPIWIGSVLCAAGVVLSIPWTRTGVERRALYERFEEQVHSMWETIPFESGFVVWDDDMNTRLRLYQLLRGEKRGLTVVHPTLLLQERPRREFQERFGMDPLAAEAREKPARVTATGVPVFMPEAVVSRSLNEQSPLPVVVFDPSVPSVRLLKKPAAPDSVP
jgi:hypothetical protein